MSEPNACARHNFVHREPNLYLGFHAFRRSSTVPSRKYRVRERCFAAQLGKLVNATGDVERLLHQSVAVSSGLRLAYFAYKAHEVETGRRETLRDVGSLSSDQLLFASFCFTQCHNVGKLAEVLNLRFGRRSLGEILCNVAVANMLEFAEAFACPLDAKMNSLNRCRIW